MKRIFKKILGCCILSSVAVAPYYQIYRHEGILISCLWFFAVIAVVCLIILGVRLIVE